MIPEAPKICFPLFAGGRVTCVTLVDLELDLDLDLDVDLDGMNFLKYVAFKELQHRTVQVQVSVRDGTVGLISESE